MNKNFIFQEGDILIEDGIIIEIADEIDRVKREIFNVTECKDYIILPGFVNSHTHNPSSLYRGLLKEKTYDNWLDDTCQGKIQKLGYEFLDKSVTKEEFHVLLLNAYTEFLNQGITTVVENGQSEIKNVVHWIEEIMQTSNIRGIIDVYQEIDSYYDKSDEYIRYCTHLPEEENITDRDLLDLKMTKDKYPSLRMTHCLETHTRKKLINHKYHKSTVELYDEFDLLDKNSILFHCTHVTNNDIELIAERQSSVVYCPISNYINGAGYAPLEKFLQEDINVLLGTDLILSDLWEVMRNTYYYLKTHSEIDRYTAEDIFKMVTTNAYKVLAPELKIGLIDIDYKADLQFINKENTKIWPLVNTHDFSNVLHNIIIYGRPNMIEHLMIDGNWVIKNNKIIPYDAFFISKRYQNIMKKLYDNI